MSWAKDLIKPLWSNCLARSSVNLTTLLFQFFLCLFTRQIFKSLIHFEAIERTAAVYWFGPHLKNLLPQIIQPRFNATHSLHPYFTFNHLSLLTSPIYLKLASSHHQLHPITAPSKTT